MYRIYYKCIFSEVYKDSHLSPVAKSDEGWYRCVTYNHDGGETADAYLHVLDLCHGVDCQNLDKICVANYTTNSASCKCRDVCREISPGRHTTASRQVCGTDCITYYSPCILRQEACDSGREIGVLRDGPCPAAFEELFVSILGAPGPLVFFTDDVMILECLTLGSPPPTVTWYKLLPDGRKSFVSIGTELHFSRALLDDSGVYFCVAENCLDNKVQSQAVHADVKQRLKFQPLKVPFLGI